jgi:hypothetical protein
MRLLTFSDITDTDIEQVRSEIPEIAELKNPEIERKCALVWARFLRESSYKRISDMTKIPGVTPKYDLASHTRHVIRNCVFMAQTLKELGGYECDRELLLAAAVIHDASQLLETNANNKPTEDVGVGLLHAQLGAVRALEVGLSPKVAQLVTLHPYTPPHIHLTPPNPEFLILTWADIGAVDPIFCALGLPTHVDIKKRFFSLD